MKNSIIGNNSCPNDSLLNLFTMLGNSKSDANELAIKFMDFEGFDDEKDSLCKKSVHIVAIGLPAFRNSNYVSRVTPTKNEKHKEAWDSNFVIGYRKIGSIWVRILFTDAETDIKFALSQPIFNAFANGFESGKTSIERSIDGVLFMIDYTTPYNYYPTIASDVGGFLRSMELRHDSVQGSGMGIPVCFSLQKADYVDSSQKLNDWWFRKPSWKQRIAGNSDICASIFASSTKEDFSVKGCYNGSPPVEYQGIRVGPVQIKLDLDSPIIDLVSRAIHDGRCIDIGWWAVRDYILMRQLLKQGRAAIVPNQTYQDLVVSDTNVTTIVVALMDTPYDVFTKVLKFL